MGCQLVNMVDCGNLRCLQERRVFKKELLTWNKKIPLLIGLEAVAQELLGRKKSRKLIKEPWNRLESGKTKDWEPQSSCQFCEARNQLSDSRKLNGDQDIKNENGVSHSQIHIEEGKPLDLSASSPLLGKSPTKDSLPLTKPVVELKVPTILTKSGKRKDGNGKKGYSEDDLTAALSDIRSGKLGTRRAAVLYGIPRSTLRNKICKESYPSSTENKLTMGDLLQGGTANGNHEPEVKKEPTEEDWHRKLESLRRKHNLFSAERKFGMPSLYDFYGIGDYEKLYSLASPYNQDLRYSLLPELVRKMAEERVALEREMVASQEHDENTAADLTIPDSRKHTFETSNQHSSPASNTELKIPSYKPMRSFGAESPLVEQAQSYESKPDLLSASSKIGDTLKDIIAKTIAEKVRSRATHIGSYGSHFSALSPQPYQNGTSEHSVFSPKEPLSPVKKPRLLPKERNGNSSHAERIRDRKSSDSSDSKTMKKTRPKRGQYRKYNSQLLLEAVRAVQRGEMSVHRAGSYFGVPHSTLEYKVKERHLLRQKKPRESKKKSEPSTNNSSPASSQPSSPKSKSVDSPLFSSTPTVAVPSMSMASPMPLVFAWPPANGAFALDPHPSTLAAYSSGFALNTSASELLKKLQQKVQQKVNVSEGEEGEEEQEEEGSESLADDEKSESPELESKCASPVAV